MTQTLVMISVPGTNQSPGWMTISDWNHLIADAKKGAPKRWGGKEITVEEEIKLLKAELAQVKKRLKHMQKIANQQQKKDAHQ